MVMAIGKPADDPSAIEPFRDVVELVLRVCSHPADTQVRRRAWSKPADRVGESDHEESKGAR